MTHVHHTNSSRLPWCCELWCGLLVQLIYASVRLVVSSNDVIHSFALPSLALKVDAIPGRLNSVGLIVNRPSLFYGQCSE
jgi:hypothetical protein